MGFRSPVSKLLPYFLRSRDQWKAKCKAAKDENKSLKIRLAKMKASRDRWKAIARGGESSAETASSAGAGETKNRL
jgi:hypothetical protein